ncbi:hemolysin III family protein [Candidatus Bipolaricaulota bacterium]|nr:hemolysin III family protein [Candidatus Bipolaricaulota bacterium]
MPKQNELTGKYTYKEEIANSITHGIGTVLSVAGLVGLLYLSVPNGGIWRIISSIIYGTALILCQASSTFYHALRLPRAKKLFSILDHNSIFLLIAGTYTPFLLVTLRGNWGWGLFITIWSIVIVGILYESFFTDKYPKVSTSIYVGMGWISLIVLGKLYSGIGLPGILWLILGGIIYTSGTWFYTNGRLSYNHAIWHLFVLAGAACHYISILFYVIPSES